MEKRFKQGDEVYLMVKVHDTEPTGGYDYTIEWKDAVDGMACLASVGQAQLVSNADFGTSNGIDWQATYNEYSEKAQRTIAGLSKRITELNETVKACTESENIVRTNFTAKCDEIMVLKSENERLSKQNEELGAKVDDLEAELQNAQKSIDYNNKMEKSRTRLVNGQTMTIYRKDKVINVLIDKIVALEMMLDEEREKHNG